MLASVISSFVEYYFALEFLAVSTAKRFLTAEGLS